MKLDICDKFALQVLSVLRNDIKHKRIYGKDLSIFSI